MFRWQIFVLKKFETFIENKLSKNFTAYRQKKYWSIIWYICLSFFLWIGPIFALFHWVANVPAAIELWNIKVSEWATELVQSLIILTEILSWPCTLLTSKALIILVTSDSLGKTLLFETNVYCFEKKELKIFASSRKSVTNAPLNKEVLQELSYRWKKFSLSSNTFYSLLADHLAFCWYFDKIPF